MIDNVKVCEPFSHSYHIMTFDLLYDSNITTWNEYYFDYRRCNYKEMDKSLQGVELDTLFCDNNINKKWAKFKEVMDNAASKIFPRRNRRTRQE